MQAKKDERATEKINRKNSHAISTLKDGQYRMILYIRKRQRDMPCPIVHKDEQAHWRKRRDSHMPILVAIWTCHINLPSPDVQVI